MVKLNNSLKSKLLGMGITIFTFVIPLIIAFTTYFQITDSPRVALNIIGILLVVIIVLLWIRSSKKRIKLRQEQGFYNSPYKILVVNKILPFLMLICLTWFLNVVQTDVRTLYYVVFLITISVGIGFIINILQIKIDKEVAFEIKKAEVDRLGK